MMWKMGRNLEYIKRKMQDAIKTVDQPTTVVLTKKISLPDMTLEMYMRNFEIVRVFKFLGVI